MPIHPLRSLKVDHRPLHSVTELALALALPQTHRLLLPDQLSKPASPWVTTVTVVVIALVLGVRLLVMPEFQDPPVKWIVIAGTGLLAGAAMWWMERERLSPAGGWLVDFAQGRLMPVRQTAKEAIAIEPNEYSLGCYATGGSSTATTFALELRHVRRGPVAQLSSVPLPGSGSTFEREREQLDLCVDLLAQRLRIRRSGEPLVKTGRRGAAS